MLIHTFVNTTMHEDKKSNGQRVLYSTIFDSSIDALTKNFIVSSSYYLHLHRVYCEKEKALKY